MPIPSQIDVTAPFDPTAYTSISGAQLLQLVSGLYPYSDKGFIIASADVGDVPEVPNATVTTKWQKYIWLRIGATSVTPYIWNDNASNHNDGSGNGILKWYTIASASIGVGSITGDMIANFTIPDAKIISLSASKISGSFNPGTTAIPSGPAGGDLAGTYPNPAIAPLAVTTGKIALLNITNALIAANTIDATTKVAPNAVAYTQLRTNVGATALEYFVPQVIVNLTNPAATADVGKFVVVDSPYTNGYTTKSPTVALAGIRFTSALVATIAPNASSAANVLINVAHNLAIAGVSTAPLFVRAVLVAQGAVGGYIAGDEVNVEAFSISSGGQEIPAFTAGASATNVFGIQNYDGTGADGIGFASKVNGSRIVFVNTDWRIKIYASL